MCDPIETFEYVLRNAIKRSLAIYSDNKQENKHAVNPRDVISNVSSQLKAIQGADTHNNKKSASKELLISKKCTYLSVNKLPMYEELPKQFTKFDTQCVTDTQLINVIEDAEILDVHQEMMQEFETSFDRLNTEKHIHEHIDTKSERNINNDIEQNIDNLESDNVENNDTNSQSNVKDFVNDKVVINIAETDENMKEEEEEEKEQFSQILNSKTVKTKNKMVKLNTTNNTLGQNTKADKQTIGKNKRVFEITSENYTDTEENTDILNQCIEVEVDKDRSPSPVFTNKNIIKKSKSLSPLVFNLDKFEQFENIAISLLEMNKFTAKHVNSQILDKELHLNINEKIELNQKDKPDEGSKSLINKRDVKVNEIDETKKTKDETDAYEDEILFSSDEEYYVHKDLPFTCALDTSFYNQSDILDKTMYVGFQTASNRSIQVGTGSFVRAKSLLDDVVADDVTVTELVKNCDNCEDKGVNMDNNDEYVEDGNSNAFTEDTAVLPSLKPPEGCMGFMTANNKKIILSGIGVARCKKVFQDIDLNEDFDAEKITEEIRDITKDRKENKHYSDDDKVQNEKDIYPIEDLQAIDEEIMQEFENIEMSLGEDKLNREGKSPESKIETVNNRNKTTDDDSAKTKDFNFEEDLNGINKNKNAEEDIVSQIISNTKAKDVTKIGFKTAGNKVIKISIQAWAKSKIILENIDDVKLPNLDREPNIETKSNITKFVGFKTANDKNVKISDKAIAKTKDIFKDILANDVKSIKSNEDTLNSNEIPINVLQLNMPSTSKGFVGFKTANNEHIISDKAWIKAKNIFDDIDSTELLNIKTENIIVDNTSNHFVGFKTANNNNIQISKEALAKTKHIFNDIDASDFLYTINNKDDKNTKIMTENKIVKETIIENPDATSISSKTFNGLAQTNDIEESEFTTELLEVDKDRKVEFIGFKTANNKRIKISNEALAKSKNIFKDIDKNDFKISENKNNYQNFEENKEEVKQSATDKEKLEKVKDASKLQETDNRKQPDTIINIKNVFGGVDNQIDKTPEKADPTKLFNKRDTKQTSPIFKGFQTANKKPVSISAKALEKSKKMFEEFDVTQPKAGFSSFQNASNKPVNVSTEALAKSKKFKNIDNNWNKEKPLYPQEIYQTDENTGTNLNNKVEEMNTVFEGFSTASKKPVAISKSAIENSKKIFQDLEKADIIGLQTEDNKINTRESNNFKGFLTASNKNVKISDEALAKSKKLFEDIHLESNSDKIHQHTGLQIGTKNIILDSKEVNTRSKRLISEVDNVDIIANKKERKDTITNITDITDIHAIVDTQVIKYFDESLHTEDFHVTPKADKSKRSGSPILSCPRAKKRKKFEVPYNTKNIPQPIINTTEIAINKDKIIFTENYKKDKKYTLKDMANITKDNPITINPYLLNFEYDNLLQFEFNQDRNGLSYGNMKMFKLKEYFLNSVNAKLVPDGWLNNHIKLILWKLISYEVIFKSVICTAKNVIDQLKYRYDKELYNAERPALRKIFEKDDIPSKTMVLCVVGVYVDGQKVTSAPPPQSNIELLLTDGWYCILSSIDALLSQQVCSNKICVGSKIVVCGAELSGSEQAVAPWEDTSSIRLKIFGNSTRRARWDARLGYYGNGAILSQLSSVSVLGGKVCKLRLYVTRVYPALYVEKFEDGSTVTRSERLENIHQMKVEAERQVIMEKLYEDVERELADQESQEDSLSDSKRSLSESGSQIAKMMKRSKDPGEFRSHLSISQVQLLEQYTTKKRDLLLQNIQSRVRDKVEKEGVCINRNVVDLLKIRVAGVRESETVEVCKGMMSIWKPNDAIREIIKEGSWIEVLNVVPTALRYSEIQISAGRQSIFSTSKYKPLEKFQPYLKLLQRHYYTIKELAQNPSMNTDYNEIDTVGLIFLIDPSIAQFDSTKQSFQNIYLADADKNIICVNFWGGLKKFGYQNVLDTGQIIICGNLQKRAGNTKKTIPQYRVTEFSYFTQTPRNDARKLLEELNKKLSGLDRRKFCQDCVVLKNNFATIKQNNENISPYRDINLSKNKIFIDSPLVKKEDFNLTGLDFESTFKQEQLSDEVLKRKRKVKEKIAKLKMYGEPPPLSPIHLINISKYASNCYKSPFNNSNNNNSLNNKNDSCKHVASVENTPIKYGENSETDPVILNRTYVKSVNPVKLNFDVNDSNIDQFAEEFDGSPPLSLD